MNKFVSVLDKFGAFGKDIWHVAEPVLVDTEKVVNEAAPGISILVPAFGPLWNMTETLIKTAESAAAAAGAQKAGKQKLAFVLASLLPYAVQDAQKLGIVQPTSAQVTAWIDLAVQMMKVYGSLPS